MIYCGSDFLQRVKPWEVSNIWETITIHPKDQNKSVTDVKSLLTDVPSFNYHDKRSRFDVTTPVCISIVHSTLRIISISILCIRVALPHPSAFCSHSVK